MASFESFFFFFFSFFYYYLNAKRVVRGIFIERCNCSFPVSNEHSNSYDSPRNRRDRSVRERNQPVVVFPFERVISIGDIDTVACQRNTQIQRSISLSLFFSFSFNLEGVAGSHRWKRRFGNSYLLGSRTREREKTNSHRPNSPDKFYPAPSCFTPLLSIPSFLLSFFINFSFPTPSSPPSLSRNFLIISRGENAPLLPVPFHSSLLSFPRRRRKERFADRHLDTVFFIFLAFISFSSPPSRFPPAKFPRCGVPHLLRRIPAPRFFVFALDCIGKRISFLLRRCGTFPFCLFVSEIFTVTNFASTGNNLFLCLPAGGPLCLPAIFSNFTILRGSSIRGKRERERKETRRRRGERNTRSGK